jgi:hypothetical protein
MAARLTDRALQALSGGSKLDDSVDVELQLWHALEAELERDHRWQRTSARHGDTVGVEQILQQVVCRATRRVGGTMETRH